MFSMFQAVFSCFIHMVYSFLLGMKNQQTRYCLVRITDTWTRNFTAEMLSNYALNDISDFDNETGLGFSVFSFLMVDSNRDHRAG